MCKQCWAMTLCSVSENSCFLGPAVEQAARNNNPNPKGGATLRACRFFLLGGDIANTRN